MSESEMNSPTGLMNIYDFYDLDNFSEELLRIGQNGQIDPRTGRYLFYECKFCKGPMFGHKDCATFSHQKHNSCDTQTCQLITQKWEDETSNEIAQIYNSMTAFKIAVAQLDKIKAVSTCYMCDKIYQNRLNLENHMRGFHKELDFKSRISIRDAEQTHEGSHASASPRDSTPVIQQLVKAPEIPNWTKGMEFKDF